MNIAIASGKGGTGKTTTAASLVHVWPRPVVAVDLDVEEPNLHLFLKPQISGSRKATMQVPVPDESKCSYCRVCADLCQFKAIAVLGTVLLTFPEMCHGCGGCMAVCPENALSMGERELGDILWGRAANADFLMGRLRVGEAMSPPLMRSVKQTLAEMIKNTPKDVIVDAPPGVSCPAVNAVMDSDAIILVTEPTPFGLYDLRLAVEAFTPLDKPMAVIINRWGIGHQAVDDFCQSKNLPILARIPYRRDIAEAYAQGKVIAAALTDLGQLFSDVATRAENLTAGRVEAAHA